YDGTVSIVQPLIAPLYNGKSAHELLAAMSDRPERSGYDIVREFWKIDPKNDADWRRWLHDGVIPDSAPSPRQRSVTPSTGAAAVKSPPESGIPQSTGSSGPFEIIFRNDPCVLDGRFANNGWLQELPKPITKLAWDNAILVSPATAARLGAGGSPSVQGGEH